MNNSISHWALAGLLSVATFSALAATSDAGQVNTPAEGGTTVAGSALPPGVNPTTPAGGNGGDAAGYDHMPKAGDLPRKTAEAPGREKQRSGTDRTQTPEPKHSGSTPEPKHGASGSQ
jgi:hypothetical protein